MRNEASATTRTFLTLANGSPSHDTFGRVFSRLDPVRRLACTRQWLDEIGCQIGERPAVDGITWRRSFHNAADKQAFPAILYRDCNREANCGGAMRDDDQVEQFVLRRPLCSRIGKFLKRREDRDQSL